MLVYNVIVIGLLESIGALFFLSLGYLLGRLMALEEIIEKKDNTTRMSIKPQSHTKAGVINYPSQEEIDYRESGEEAVDKERERVFREQFKL